MGLPARRATRLRRFWRSPTTSDVTVAVLVPATAAIFGLVLEDAIPKPGEPQVFAAFRIALLLGVTAALIAAVYRRRQVYGDSGTLFSVSFLDETMRDFHEQALDDAERDHMALRVIGRRLDLQAREDNGLIDVVEPRRELSRALEDGLNQDRDDTGYAMAPNVLWPAALAVGASLTRAKNIKFIEFGPVRESFVPRQRSSSAETDALAIAHVETCGLERPTGDRHGIYLGFTRSARKFAPALDFGLFGVRDATVITPVSGDPEAVLGGRELEQLGWEVGHLLASARRERPDRELVIVAFVPKTVSLLAGWYVSRAQLRFFADTHLMFRLDDEHPFRALRVHPSQPTHFPSVAEG